MQRRGQCFPLLKGDGAGGTGGEAIPQSIAVVLTDEAGFARLHHDGAFMAGLGTEAAAVALLFIDADDFANHVIPPGFLAFALRSWHKDTILSLDSLLHLQLVRKIYVEI